MTEWKLFDGDVAAVSTAEFHRDRERAPHLEQWNHRPRLERAMHLVGDAIDVLTVDDVRLITVSDLGCGDGGLLQLLKSHVPNALAYGYDFQPSNLNGWAERGVDGRFVDVFGGGPWLINPDVALGEVVVATEVLEHLTWPHAVLREVVRRGLTRYVVASSPWTEHAGSHDACHAWAWDHAGYHELFTGAGLTVIKHESVDMFQLVLAEVAT